MPKKTKNQTPPIINHEIDNKTIAAIFARWGSILKHQGNTNEFRIRAYFKGAAVIKGLSEPAHEILLRDSKITGLGDKSLLKLTELFETGVIAEFEALKKTVVSGSTADYEALLKIDGVGEKLAEMLVKDLGIKTVADLEAACKAGKVRILQRQSERTELKILEGIDRYKTDPGRIPRDEAMVRVQPILDSIRPFCDRLELVGSARRERPDVKDVDIMIVPSDFDLLDAALKPFEHQLVVKGDAIYRFRVDGLMIDIQFCPAEEWGSTLLYRTGSKELNIRMRADAKSKGLMLNEHGLFVKATGELLARDSEAAIFAALGWEYIEPVDR